MFVNAINVTRDVEIKEQRGEECHRYFLMCLMLLKI